MFFDQFEMLVNIQSFRHLLLVYELTAWLYFIDDYEQQLSPGTGPIEAAGCHPVRFGVVSDRHVVADFDCMPG